MRKEKVIRVLLCCAQPGLQSTTKANIPNVPPTLDLELFLVSLAFVSPFI
jgi:hypothetical protein